MPSPLAFRHRIVARLTRGRRPWVLATGSALALALAIPGWAAPPKTDPASEPPQHLPLTARWCLTPGRCILLEQPVGERQQALGLQLRTPLPPLRGMWFRFSPPTPVRFWMHRTPAPLDIVFVQAGQVVAIAADAHPCMHLPCPTYGTDQAVDGVLELAAGQAKAQGIAVGTPVRLETLSPAMPNPEAPQH